MLTDTEDSQNTYLQSLKSYAWHFSKVLYHIIGKLEAKFILLSVCYPFWVFNSGTFYGYVIYLTPPDFIYLAPPETTFLSYPTSPEGTVRLACHITG